MSTTAFDTLSAAQDLEAAASSAIHAEAIAKVVNHGDERAATKADLDTAVTALRSELRATSPASKRACIAPSGFRAGPSSPS